MKYFFFVLFVKKWESYVEYFNVLYFFFKFNIDFKF